MTKKKYKEQRKNKYYSYKVDFNKDQNIYNYYKLSETQNFNEYENFVQNINSRYKMVSMINIYTLQGNKSDVSLINKINLEYTG